MKEVSTITFRNQRHSCGSIQGKKKKNLSISAARRRPKKQYQSGVLGQGHSKPVPSDSSKCLVYKNLSLYVPDVGLTVEFEGQCQIVTAEKKNIDAY
ncbi:hypothetical protein CDAR_169011 [Caerostris darwini]|uniref:Uncharacterized protein n=1 Tax=Caerostris darwini TaxID=1538125 RepID=A0AAV4WNU4_9ARAC|nr:hypothetical protein CDAR_169011 [Caerostris darwini]